MGEDVLVALSGIARIDNLVGGVADTQPLRRDDPDREAVGSIQELLAGHGASKLPGILGTGRGLFGPQTAAAVAAFQADHGLASTGEIDSLSLHALVTAVSISPIASQSYLTLVLDIPWTGFARLVALTAQFEAAGKFTARNRNTDRAGLSFGIIQWAQKPRRLAGLLQSFERAQPLRFLEVFGGGDAATATDLLAHTAGLNGGVVPATGHTLNPRFDLVNDAWTTRFIEAGRDRQWQKTQLLEAITAFRSSANVIRNAAPTAKSERAVAFLLDVANQHGDGGMRNICSACKDNTGSEALFLQAVQNESVRRLVAQFGAGSSEAVSTFNRREVFRTSRLLSDGPFLEA